MCADDNRSSDNNEPEVDPQEAEVDDESRDRVIMLWFLALSTISTAINAARYTYLSLYGSPSVLVADGAWWTVNGPLLQSVYRFWGLTVPFWLWMLAWYVRSFGEAKPSKLWRIIYGLFIISSLSAISSPFLPHLNAWLLLGRWAAACFLGCLWFTLSSAHRAVNEGRD